MYSTAEIRELDDPRIQEIYEFCVSIHGPETMCVDDAEVPNLDLLRWAAENDAGMRLWAVYDVDNGDLVGMIITDPSGQFVWLKAKLEIIGPMTYDAGQQITRLLGTKAWGIMHNPTIRELIATSGPSASCDNEEHRVWWNG
jgi:hypothetical protein